MNKIESQFRDLFLINENLQEVINSLADRTGIQETNQNVVISFFLAKSMKTHNSALKLCRLGHGEDANILVRTIFDSMISVKYMIKYDLYDRYLAWDIVIRDKMLLQIKDNPKLKEQMKTSLSKQGETINSLHKRALNNQEKYGFANTTWSLKNLYDMAKDVNELDSYNKVFRQQSQ